VAVEPVVKIEGLKALNKHIRSLKDDELNAAMKKVNHDAGTIVSKSGKTRAPTVSGKLKASIKSSKSKAYVQVQVGTRAKTPYAGPIHFGWRKRNIRPNKFMYKAMRSSWPRVIDKYEEGFAAVVRLLEKGN